MVAGAALMVLTLLGLGGEVASLGLNWPVLLGAWLLGGTGLTRRSSPPPAACCGVPPMRRIALRSSPLSFALSHACWLVTYPLSGWLMTQFGPGRGPRDACGAGRRRRAIRLCASGQRRIQRSSSIAMTTCRSTTPHLKGVRRHAHPFRRGRPAPPLGVTALSDPQRVPLNVMRISGCLIA